MTSASLCAGMRIAVLALRLMHCCAVRLRDTNAAAQHAMKKAVGMASAAVMSEGSKLVQKETSMGSYILWLTAWCGPTNIDSSDTAVAAPMRMFQRNM